MKMLLQSKRFETTTILEDNKTIYVVTTRGKLLSDNTPSKAITFDFRRLDKKKLSNKEEKIGDEIFNSIIKDKHDHNRVNNVNSSPSSYS